jgi:hypothetical protein
MKKIMIMWAACLFVCACNNEKKEEPKTTETSVSGETKKTGPIEFADSRYMDIGRKMTNQIASGDMDGWLANYADNAVFQWSAGDSLAGKEAIGKYWKDRRMNVLDSLTITSDIWLPVKVITPQQGPDQPGVWLLSWYMVTSKYKNGKKLSFWVHTDHHFDANDKIDRTIQYIDRAPINAALGKK